MASKIWGREVEAGKSMFYDGNEGELYLCQAVLLSPDCGCTLKVKLEMRNSEHIVARLIPQRPNISMQMVLMEDATFTLEGPSGAKVQLLGVVTQMDLPPPLIDEDMQIPFEDNGLLPWNFSSNSDSTDDFSDDGDTGEDLVPADLHPQVEEIIEDNLKENEDKKMKNADPSAPLFDADSSLCPFGQQLRQLEENSSVRTTNDDVNKTSNVSRGKRAGPAPAPASSKKIQTSATINTNEESLGIVKKMRDGLKYEVLSEGKGSIASVGKKVVVEYEGRLQGKTKTKFDSGKIDFVVGKGEMIQGFDIGVRGMMVGEKRRIFVPSRMGYGRKGIGPIPPNADIEFDVLLKAVK